MSRDHVDVVVKMAPIVNQYSAALCAWPIVEGRSWEHSIAWYMHMLPCCQCGFLERLAALYMIVRSQKLYCSVLHVCCNPNRPDFSEA